MLTQAILSKRIAEARKVFDAHKEAKDMTMDKKLIINVAAGGSFINRSHNPHLPVTTGEVAREVIASYRQGAGMFHFHPRDPETQSVSMPVPRRLEIHKAWCDSIFEGAPDIVTDVGGIYVNPPKIDGGFVDEESITAENRIAALIDPLVAMGPNNRYVEVGIVLCHTAALGGTCLLSFNNRVGVTSDVNFLQSRNIRVELSPFKHSDLQDVRQWVVDSGPLEKPAIIDTLLGIHNSPKAVGMEGLELLFAYVRMLPKGFLWQALVGGRYWLPLAATAIMLGADIVRVGKEDAVYWHAHRDEVISDSAEVVEAVAGIARTLGREVATPAETRQILGLLQIGSREARHATA